MNVYDTILTVGNKSPAYLMDKHLKGSLTTRINIDGGDDSLIPLIDSRWHETYIPEGVVCKGNPYRDYTSQMRRLLLTPLPPIPPCSHSPTLAFVSIPLSFSTSVSISVYWMSPTYPCLCLLYSLMFLIERFVIILADAHRST